MFLGCTSAAHRLWVGCRLAASWLRIGFGSAARQPQSPMHSGSEGTDSLRKESDQKLATL